MRHSSFLEIDLGLLAGNVANIQRLAGSSKLLPMVKADAYGNGLLPVSQFLTRECGIKKLGCATLAEALRIFQESPDLDLEILVFSDTEIEDPAHRALYGHARLTPVLHRLKDLEIFLKDPVFQKTPLVLKLNTGMNRLGLNFEELEIAAGMLKGRAVDHLMTHFACSYYVLKDNDKTHRQMAEFLKMKKYLEARQIEVRETSVANSGAIEQSFGIDQSYVRPGLMMYGPYSVEPQIWQGKQISRLVTKVLKTFSVKKGTPVGYGINVTSEDSFIAIVALGYGDGLMTFASGVEINVKGIPGKIFARVNMDMAYLIFNQNAQGQIQENESIEIWNHDPRIICEMANQMKTHPYQLMCGITNRVPRIYKVK
jgi:alanine racemase